MANKTERIEARVESRQADRIRLASKLTKTPVSRFITNAASEKAEQVIVESQFSLVSPQYFEDLLIALDAEPRPIDALSRAAQLARDTPAFKQVG